MVVVVQRTEQEEERAWWGGFAGDDFCTYAGDCCCDVDDECSVAPTTDGSCENKCGSYSQKDDGSYCYCECDGAKSARWMGRGNRTSKADCLFVR